jgi:hypothetical protein
MPGVKRLQKIEGFRPATRLRKMRSKPFAHCMPKVSVW